MAVTIHPNEALPNTADLSNIPGDKSISHRLALLGALADGPSTIHNFLRSDDCLNTLAIIQQLGVPVTDTDTAVTIHGVGLHGLRPAKKVLNVGNSGTAIRLLTGVLAAQTFASTLTGDASIQSRPMARVTQPLALMGARIDSEYAPLHIPGGTVLSGVDYTLPIPSAQVKSALLFAGLYAEQPHPHSRTHPLPRSHRTIIPAFSHSPNPKPNHHHPNAAHPDRSTHTAHCRSARLIVCYFFHRIGPADSKNLDLRAHWRQSHTPRWIGSSHGHGWSNSVPSIRHGH